MTPYRALILDLDGTLVDSNDAHARAWVHAFTDEGFSVSFAQVRPLIGMGGDQLVPRLTGVGPESEQYERLSEAWKDHFQRGELPTVRAQPGARKLVEELRRRGLDLIIGTSGDETVVEALLMRADVADLVPQRTTAPDVEDSKPAPDIVQAALKKLGRQPGEVLMLGDTAYDIDSAGKSGVDTVALRCGGAEDGRLAGAIKVYNDPLDLLVHLDDLALG
ncbi:HAD family hydrolase [Deinococcus marmoris]|uniref:Hydrolase, CbbY/CbbZ/GpH/YieH family n=1 Tax=Deinococcus marmoris TaxID=249408 RepID=A0A1U7NTD2_9DEIO|nr:HAD family hydrolase [Deinococcus marmoris]OLV16184.1 hydrolase, CbbY/CbbZ/GpH/YieH family [Deinococcus marmoris]